MNNHLNSVFSRYVGMLHNLPNLQRLMPTKVFAIVDVFAHVPILHTHVLCWSSLTSRTTNRVFIPSSDPIVQTMKRLGRPVLLPRHEVAVEPGDNDVTMHISHPGLDAVAYVPVLAADRHRLGFVRIVGRRSELKVLGLIERQEVIIAQQPPRHPAALEPDLYPHVLGRWAGSEFTRLSEAMKGDSVHVLLDAFSSFVGQSHNTYWHKDFHEETVAFAGSTTAGTEAILGRVKDPLRQPKHMFGIVARYGNAEFLPHFPEDLETTRSPNLRDWRPDDAFSRLHESLGQNALSYYCIPLKVDDCVLGVFSLLTTRDQESFEASARFARSCIAEVGRTMDKRSLGHAITKIRQTAYKEYIAIAGMDPIAVGKQLMWDIASLLLPDAGISPGVLVIGQAREKSSTIPRSAMALLEHRYWEILATQQIQVIPDDTRSTRPPPREGFLTIPITAGRACVLYLYGPLEVLAGRSLRAALEELQAVLYLAFDTASTFLTSESMVEELRASLNLWAHVHDLKNEVARFGNVMADLDHAGRSFPDKLLREEVSGVVLRFDDLIEPWKEKCDRLLDKSFYRHREQVSVYQTVATAYKRESERVPKLAALSQLEISCPQDIQILTYASELQIVLRELFRNVFKHFERTSAGRVFVEIGQHETGIPVSIAVTDSVHDPGEFERVEDALRSGTSSTLGRMRKIVERLLEGNLWVQREQRGRNLSLVLRVPKEVKPH